MVYFVFQLKLTNNGPENEEEKALVDVVHPDTSSFFKLRIWAVAEGLSFPRIRNMAEGEKAQM